MACLDLFNEHKGLSCGTFSPRISFSNDFVEAEQSSKIKIEHGGASQTAPNSDFEFSVTNYTMQTADELFFKGKLLPFKDDCTNKQAKHVQKMTLRDELCVLDDDDDELLTGASKGSNGWKELLGLRKTPAAPKKIHRNIGSFENVQGSISMLHPFSSNKIENHWGGGNGEL